MVYKNLCILMHWTKVALEGLTIINVDLLLIEEKENLVLTRFQKLKSNHYEIEARKSKKIPFSLQTNPIKGVF